MRTFASFPIALALGSSAIAQEPSYPAAELLEAFRDGCGSIENQVATSARLVATGWHKVKREEEGGPLREFLAFSRQTGAAAAAAEGAEMGELEAFENVIAGEKVFVILDEVRAGNVRISGCQLYDFGETRPIALDIVVQWLGREPDSIIDRPEIQRAEWQPGALPEHDSFKIFFVPTDSPATERVRFSGLALMSDTVGVE